MKTFDFRRQVLPHLIALLVFLIISLIFFSPVFLDNKEIFQNDILQWEGGAHSLREYRAETGEEGLWAENLFSGMPGHLVDIRYSGDITKYLFMAFGLFLPHPAGQIFAAMLCFYILLLAFRIRPYLALVGAVAFGLNTYNLINIEAGHNMKGWAIVFMPLVLAGIHMAFSRLSRRGQYTGYLLTALGLAMHIRANHLQMTYYLLLMVVLYGIVQLISYSRSGQLSLLFKHLVFLSLAAIIAVGVSFGKLWMVYEYGTYSTRGKTELTNPNRPEQESGLNREYAFQWSNGVAETLTLLVPYYYGGASGESLDSDSHFASALQQLGVPPNQIDQNLEQVPTYWGKQPFTAGPIYSGALVCFLFVLAFFTLDKRYRYWLAACVLLSLVLSWGKNFETVNYFLFDYLPGYNKFRSVSMAIVIALIAMPLMGFAGLEAYLRQQDRGLKLDLKPLYYGAGITAGLALLIWLTAGMADYVGPEANAQYPEVLKQALRNDRQELRRDDAFRSALFILLGGGLLWLGFHKKLQWTYAIAGFGALVAIDLWLVDTRYLNDDNFGRNPRRQFFAETEADQFIKQRNEENARVLNLMNPWNDARTSYHHASLGGYHGAKMRRYQDLIDNCLGQEVQQLIGELQQGRYGLSDYGILNMLNARFILAGQKANAVLENPEALGHAWLVEDVVPVQSADAEMQTLCDINTEKQAVIDVSEFPIGQQNFSGAGTISLVESAPNKRVYQAELSEEGLAVFSEIFFPIGWTASIDGEETEILRANYVLRALQLPAGEHTVTFTFSPQSYALGNTIMLISSALLYLLLIAGLVYGFRSSSAKEA